MAEQDALRLYFLIAPALYLVNTIIAATFSVKYKKDPIYRRSAAIWFCYLVLGVAQGVLENASYEIRVTAFSLSSFFAVSAMGFFVSDIYKIKTNFKLDAILFTITFVAMQIMFKLDVPFLLAALPATFFASYPVIKLLPLLRNYTTNGFTKNGILICYILISLHGVDYAYAGNKPELLFPGYLLALMLAMGASGFTFSALIERAIIEVEMKEVLQSTARLTALGGMAAEITHEIKNPLTVLSLNNAQMKQRLMSTPNTHVDIEYFKNKFEIAEKMLKRLIDIMNTLRSHYNSGVNDDFKQVKIQDIFIEVNLLCTFRAQKSLIKVEFKNESEELFVECRSVQIIQALQNLVQNAMDEIENKPEPLVIVEAKYSGLNFVELSVMDNGAGIPPEIRANIFNSFFTTKPKEKGSGLGLTITRRYIDDHGGQFYLDYHSKQTRFVIILPILQANKLTKRQREQVS